MEGLPIPTLGTPTTPVTVPLSAAEDRPLFFFPLPSPCPSHARKFISSYGRRARRARSFRVGAVGVPTSLCLSGARFPPAASRGMQPGSAVATAKCGRFRSRDPARLQ